MTIGPIRALFDGPLDIVGDVHGEAGALNQLMIHLGYHTDGRHPDGRRLVFVGDLVDRGEDSPAVVERVADLVGRGLAQCVLGNHELNLVIDARKEGNGWFYEAGEDHDHVNGHFLEVPRASGSQRQVFADWFATLPLALEREDLRVVHACWHQPSVDVLRNDTRQIADIYEGWSDLVDAHMESKGLDHARQQEQGLWHERLTDRRAIVPMLPAMAEVESLKQTMHPVKALTSGLERITQQPFFGGGKWRMTEREPWWDSYIAPQAVVFGHYWRWAGDESHAAARSRGPNLFEGRGSSEWLGPNGNAMCVDYCAGLRWRERKAGATSHEGLLAALQWPERRIVCSDKYTRLPATK